MRVTTALLMVFIASPAFAATLSEKTGVNSALGIAPKTSDFVSEVAMSDMFEIQSSTLASTKLTGPGKDFADRMVTDHTKTTADLTADAKEKNIPLPVALDSSHQKMLDKLKTLDGTAFSKQYFDDQVSAHKSAVNLFKRYSNGGKDAKLKGWATATLPTLNDHLKMAQDLDK